MENKDSKVWDIMVKSDLLNEILEKTPMWIIRWGNTLFLVFILSLIALTAFIQYPDVITARLELVTQNPPIEVKALVDGKIDTLFFTEKAQVKEGQMLARIYSIARYPDILRAEQQVSQGLAIDNFADYLKVDFPEGLELGELSTAYTDLLKATTQYRYFSKQNYVFKKIRSLEKEVVKIRELNQSLQNQEKIHAEEVKLTETEHDRNKGLQQQGLISDLEFESSKAELLRINREFEMARMGQINNDLQVERLSIQKEELLNTRNQEINSQVQNIRELLNDLQSLIIQWKENYLIKAPISGELAFDERWTLEQPLNAGQTLFNLIPNEANNKIIGVCQMPTRNSGEVKKGILVQVRLDAFPYQEYGIIEGNISSIGSITQTSSNAETFSRVELAFPDTLYTTFGERLDFTQKMTGTALIIKEKRSILERIFNQIINLFKK